MQVGAAKVRRPSAALDDPDGAKPTFPAPDHDHGRCTADAIDHAERVCEQQAQKFTPIRRQVLQALLSSHRPLGAYEVIDELAKSMPRPAPITVYRALDFLMENGLVHRIESRNAYLACAHDHDAAAMVAFLICDACGSVGEIPAAPVAQSLNAAARAIGFAPKFSVVEITGTCAHCQKLHINNTATSRIDEDTCRHKPVRRPRPGARSAPGAVALMLMLCLSWGFNQIAVKLALPDIPPMLQAMIRSAGALPVMLIVGWLRGVNFFQRDGTLVPGLSRAPVRHRIRADLQRTGASPRPRARLCFSTPRRSSSRSAPISSWASGFRALQWSGLALSFAGVALAIGVPQPNVDAKVLLGDLMVVGGGALWAATTLIAKGTALAQGGAGKGARLPGRAVDPDPRLRVVDVWRNHHPCSRPAVDSLMAYQAIWVVGCTFVIWFAMVKTYSASKLSAFTFITPLFGVVAAYFIMHDTLTPVLRRSPRSW